MNHERAGQFLVEAAIALMDADLNRAVEQLEEALAREAWISGFFMQGTCPQGSPVEVSTGSTSAVSEGQADIELTGVRYGVPVLLRAWLNEESCAEKGIDDPGSVFGELIRIFAKRLGSPYLVGRAGERELADAVGALSHDFRTPLACIKGYLSLLAEGKYRPGTPEWDEYFATVLEECERLENLVSVVPNRRPPGKSAYRESLCFCLLSSTGSWLRNLQSPEGTAFSSICSPSQEKCLPIL